MYVTPEKLAATNKAGVDALVEIASVQFAALEKLTALNMLTAKQAFEDVSEQMKALADIKDPQELVKFATTLAQPSTEKAVAYGKGVYDVAASTTSTLTKLAESNAAEMNKALVALLDGMAKNAPAGSDAAVTAMKTALAAVNSAYDSIQKVAKQASDVIEVNFGAATKGSPRRKAA